MIMICPLEKYILYMLTSQLSISHHLSATSSPAPQPAVIMTTSTSGNTTRTVSGNTIVIYIIYVKVFILLNWVRKLHVTL